MAESLMDIAMVAEREESKSERDFGDCDEYSSGSDKSFEADDTDNNSRGDLAPNCHQSQPGSIRSRRTRRHGSHGSRRHKGGSRHKHKGFQPYPSKNDVEFQRKRKTLEIQEKDDAAAVIRHEDGTQFMTIPAAPFNSTQFLIDEHCANSPADIHKSCSNSVLNPCSPEGTKIHSVPSTPVESSHETITFEKKDKEFADFFITAHAESLQSLSKEELVKHYMNLEEKIAALQKKVAEAEQQQQQKHGDSCSEVTSGSVDKVCACDLVCNSDTNSLSSSNEELVDFSVVNQPSSVGESSLLRGSDTVVPCFSEDVQIGTPGCVS